MQANQLGSPNQKQKDRLSMRLMSIKYPNKFKMRAGQYIEQELIIQNDGTVPWPQDTYLVFSG